MSGGAEGRQAPATLVRTPLPNTSREEADATIVTVILLEGSADDVAGAVRGATIGDGVVSPEDRSATAMGRITGDALADRATAIATEVRLGIRVLDEAPVESGDSAGPRQRFHLNCRQSRPARRNTATNRKSAAVLANIVSVGIVFDCSGIVPPGH